jgi:2-methylcitrate dehydratase
VDDVLEQLVEFGTGLTFDDLTPDVVVAVKQRVVDTVGCAIGALGADTVSMASTVATPPARPDLAGRVIGGSDVLSATSATLINGCLIRDLDFNDTYPGGHPSDGIGALLAVASQNGATGRDLLAAVVVLYEVFIRFQMAAQLRERGWDNGFGIGIGVAAGVSRLMHLSRTQTGHAIAITATSNVPMRATRAGMLSNWKNAATAFATQIAVLSAQLAAAGMTGPEAPFTGRHGLFDLITGPIELPVFPTAGGEYYTPRAKLKYWPVVYNMQALVWATIDLRRRLNGVELDSVEVDASWSAWHESGSEPAKWDPQTRETADHSLPYIFAWTLRHGSIGHEAFDDAAYLDPDFRPVMNKVRVTPDDEITAMFPETIMIRLRATDVAGGRHTVEHVNPLGHEANPASEDEINEKFRRLALHHLGAGGVEIALKTWWEVEPIFISDAMDSLVGMHP